MLNLIFMAEFIIAKLLLNYEIEKITKFLKEMYIFEEIQFYWTDDNFNIKGAVSYINI